MWVVEMADYPLGMDGNGQAGGRIRILEDINGDGIYDRSLVFAEGLSLAARADAWGRWFGVQNSYRLWHYALEDRYLRRNPHVAPPNPRVLLTESNPRVYPAIEPEKRYHNFGQAGRFPSACGPVIVADLRLFGAGPGSDTEHAMVCEPFHNLVQHLVLDHDGNTFKAERAPGEKLDFFASEDRWCRPVMLRTGPDGALWVADMYRYMIEHPHRPKRPRSAGL